MRLWIDVDEIFPRPPFSLGAPSKSYQVCPVRHMPSKAGLGEKSGIIHKKFIPGCHLKSSRFDAIWLLLLSLLLLSH